MKTTWTALAISGAFLQAVCAAACAQVYTPAQAPSYYTSPPVSVAPSVPLLNEAQLEQLVSPIALYPDPLLGQILPASTYPSEVSEASQFVTSYPHATQAEIDGQSWEPSVAALAHYPSVLAMMAGRLDWTAALGNAFLNQQQDVLAAVQQMRLKAQAAGNLASNPQQQVIVDSGVVDIVPAGNVIYVPSYDPGYVYSQRYGITYGAGINIGPWLDIDFDWAHRGIYRGHDWDHRFDVHEDHSHERTWVRNYERPLPNVRRDGNSHQEPGRGITPDHDARRSDPYRGYAQPQSPGAFGGIQNRQDVERERQRSEVHSAPSIIVPHQAAPDNHQSHSAPSVEPHIQRPAQQPTIQRPVQQQPSVQQPRAVQPSAAPSAPNRGAFGGGSGGAVQQQSSRGHSSMHR